MTGPSTWSFVHEDGQVLRPDPARVVAKTFLPGQEIEGSGRSRATAVLDRVLAIPDDEVTGLLAATMNSYGPRHGDLATLLEDRFELVAHRLMRPERTSLERRLLIGAYFTQEYAIEAAALFNPSMVPHPDQSGLAPGTTRFVMSVRAVGEGHISSVGFRTGTIDASDTVVFDDLDPVTVLPRTVDGMYSKSIFERQYAEMSGDHSSAEFVLEALPEEFDRADLDRALSRLDDQGLTRGNAVSTVARIELIASCNYSVTFAEESGLQQRVLMPGSPSESHGIEDVRLVRFTEYDGTVEYRGTFTAFDGTRVVPQLLRTKDFQTFRLSQVSGPAAKDKGMALFPRRVGGRNLALSRWDREDNSLASSADVDHWTDIGTLQTPRQSWEIVQLGNCGPPVETPSGWLVLTHGVGPMREYSMGAVLLDLDDPRRALAQLERPLLRPASAERNGYVPNVVYSCGAMLHLNTLVVPYGCNDAAIRVALVDVPELLDAMVPTPT